MPKLSKKLQLEFANKLNVNLSATSKLIVYR